VEVVDSEGEREGDGVADPDGDGVADTDVDGDALQLLDALGDCR